MIEALVLSVFAGLMLAAAVSDVATMKIPNWISIALAAAYPPCAFATGVGLAEIGLHLAFAFAVLVVCFFAFQLGVFGGGDAKLIAACAVWTGWAFFLHFLMWTVLAGGVIALFLLFARKGVKPDPSRAAFLNRLLKPRGGVPYGVAIAFGAFVSLNVIEIAAGILR